MKKHLLVLSTVLSIANSIAQGPTSVTVTREAVFFYDWPLHADEVKVFWFDRQASNKILLKGLAYKEGNTLIFKPEFPFFENIEYEAVASSVKQSFSLSSPEMEQPFVKVIYPTSDVLPENLLRMYITFSQPMKTTGNLDEIRLIDDKNKEVKGAIFNNVYELWDDTQTQLTIIFDPARVKTGLKAHESLGRALQPNKTYKLIVSNLQNIYGQSLKETYIKTFQVIAQDIQPPNPENWKITLPKSGSQTGLHINFKDMVDIMSLKSRIAIVDGNNKAVDGEIRFKNREKTWVFTPNLPWKKEEYSIRINSRLADPSGNNLNGLFDHKIGSLKNEQEGQIIKLPFQIK